MFLSDDAKAVIALTTRLGDSSRPSLSPTHWHQFALSLANASLTPSAVFSPDFDPGLPGIPQDMAQAARELLAGAATATVAAADLQNKGIWTKTIVDDDYPEALVQRLDRLAPPVIFGVGRPALLHEPGIAIVGSRDVTPGEADAARALATAAATAGHTVVSGGARGIDQSAMNAAFVAGGNVLGIIADSLQARIRSPHILRALDAGTTTLISQQSPASGFTSGSAMARNKLIYAMSQVTVVIASDEGTGGTWSGATEALHAANGIVAVWRGLGEGPGNARLEELGAVPVTNSDDVLACLGAKPAATPEPGQLSLTD